MKEAAPLRPGLVERFGRLDAPNDFDRLFWQSQSDAAKLEAAYQMVLDYLLITTGSADEQRLDRTVESFQRF
jgi:hypothetical protein